MSPRSSPVIDRIDDQALADGVDVGALDSTELMRLISASDGVSIRSRLYRMVRYPACFVGSELVDLLCHRLALSRGQATRIGQRLLAQGLIRHVLGEQDFIDGQYFYFIESASCPSIDRNHALTPSALAELSRLMRAPGGVRVGSFRHRLVRYPNCFSGAAATDWLVRQTGESREGAERIGEAMLRANHFRHVFDQMGFRDGQFFYRFL